MFMLGFILYGTVVLLPILLQTVIGFTAVRSGLTLLPGGLAALIALPIVGKILAKVDPRRLIFMGLVILGIGVLQLSHISLGWQMRVPAADWIISRLGTSFLFVPVNVMAFANVPRTKTSQASGLLNLSRNIGGSMGISFVTTMLYQRGQHHLQRLGGSAAAVSALGKSALQASAPQRGTTAQIFLYQGLERHAMMLSFIDNFRILALLTLMVIPLLLLLKKRPPAAAPLPAGEAAG
jgi:DHA2 family multidrug resistance protein